MSVSVVVPAKNGVEFIGDCLNAVTSQDYDGDIEILVIDSGSTDGTLDEVRARPDVRLHQIPPESFDHGDTRNLGAGMTTGEAIVFLVQDAEPVDSNWLSALVRNLEEDGEVAGAFSRILPRPDASPLTLHGCEGDLCFATERVVAEKGSTEDWLALDPHTLRIRCNFNDVSSVVRRSVWERMPLERSVFGEDIKFARDALEAGWRIVFEPRSCVLHSHEYGPVSLYRRTRIDAELNMSYLGRTNVDKLRHVVIMTRRAWRDDRRYLRESGLPFGERMKWTLYSPIRRFAEFLGFWQGGRRAMREGAEPWRPAPAARPTSERPIKALFVVHAFPPESWAGVEVVAITLARALRRRGHEVVVFARSPGQESDEDRSLHPDEFDGFRIHRYVNRLAFSGVDETYRFEDAEEAFERVLLEERPDVVHALHMIHLSTGVIDRCHAHGVPCVVELCDYWARCPRVQLIRPDQTNCMIPPPGLGCAACVYEKPRLIDPLARIDRLLGSLPERWARKVPQTRPPLAPGWSKLREDTASLIRREHWVREVLMRADSLVVPSVTLSRALVELGIPPHRICICEHGMDTSWLGDGGPMRRGPRPQGEPLRVGFVGSLIWYKGLLVAARAIAALPSNAAQLHVWGDHLGAPDPVTAAQVRQEVSEATRLAEGRITFHGRFEHDQLAAIHSAMDLLLVPSLWREAYGLTVREAHLAGTPVVGSRIGGIAEGIRHDTDGLLFEPGNAEDLRRALERFIEDPALQQRLSAAAPRVRADDEEAREMEWRYRQVIGKAGGLRAGDSV